MPTPSRMTIVRPQTQLASRFSEIDHAPSVVEGVVLRSRTRLPVYRTYVAPVLFNRHENRPDTVVQALVPVLALTVPVAGVWWLLLWWAPAVAVVSLVVFLLCVASVSCDRKRTPGSDGDEVSAAGCLCDHLRSCPRGDALLLWLVEVVIG